MLGMHLLNAAERVAIVVGDEIDGDTKVTETTRAENIIS